MLEGFALSAAAALGAGLLVGGAAELWSRAASRKKEKEKEKEEGEDGGSC